MVESADTGDLKSLVPKGAYQFKSGSGHWNSNIPNCLHSKNNGVAAGDRSNGFFSPWFPTCPIITSRVCEDSSVGRAFV